MGPHRIDGPSPSRGHSRRGELAYSPDGSTLATAAHGISLTDVSDPTRPRPLGTRPDGLIDPMVAVTFGAGGGSDSVVGATTTGRVVRWADGSPAPPSSDPSGDTSATVTAVAIAGDGSLLAMAEANGRVVERDPAYPDRLVDLGAPLGDDAISALWFSSDQHTPAMASTDVVLVDVADPPHARVLGPPLSAHTNAVSALAYSPDGRLLASAGLDRLLILWDVSDPAHPRRIGDPLPAHINKITAIAFAPDGATLVTASADHTFILWDLTDPTRPRQLGDPVTASATELSDAAFSPHGDTLAIGSADGSTRMWDLDGLAAVRADPLGRACAITGKSLDIDEWAKFVPNLPYVDSCAPNAE